MDELDWTWLRSFVAVAEHGSMRAAARRLGLSQPTLSRHVQRLEEVLDVALFDRAGRGLSLSPRGTELYESAREVATAVGGFLRHARGLEEGLAGDVRITCTHAYGLYLLPEWLRAFRDRHPEITVDLVLDDSSVDLLTREAEVAVRQYRPTQGDLVARKCGVSPTWFFATEELLRRHGYDPPDRLPTTLEELTVLPFVGFDRLPYFLDAAKAMGVPMTRDELVLRSDDMAALVAATRAGVGIGALARDIGRRAGLVPLLPGSIPHAQEVWLVAHPEVQRNPRVRATLDSLYTYLSEVLAPSA